MKRRFDPSSFEPAFPNQLDAGISIRDYFAAKAMQAAIGLLPSVPNADPAQAMRGIVKSSYAFADLMLEQRTFP